MSLQQKTYTGGRFNRLSENIKSGLVFGAVIVLICLMASWLQ
jgi:hypothetical protein